MTDIVQLFFEQPFDPDWIRPTLNEAYRMDEATAINQLLELIDFTPAIERTVSQWAERLVIAVREKEKERWGIEGFMMHYELSTEERILLMCLAEALLRVPDKQTKNLLIRDKLTSAEWNKYVGASESTLVNFARWGLVFSGKILKKRKRPTIQNYLE